MKIIQDLYKECLNSEFIESQFYEVHWNKNVLFINPQLSGRSFYKFLLPYIVMFEYDFWGTAITSLDKYKPNKEYELVKVPLNSKKILWADYIVIPFTHQDLKPLYEVIRRINPKVNIVFNVDFNYYLLPKKHPLYKTFSTDEVKSIIEDNIFYSDITLVTNIQLSEYLIDKFNNDLKEKYKDNYSEVMIATFPLLLDEEIIVQNFDKEDELEVKTSEFSNNSKKLRIGIVATNYTWEDINSYKDLISEVNTKFKDEVQFVLIGFNGIDKDSEKSCFPKGMDIEHVEPCTIIHYFKQIKSSNIDLLFIPLRDNEYNQTTENYNKYLEASILKTPVMVYNIFPYNKIIENGKNGILLNKKKEFIEKIEFFKDKKDELKRIGLESYNFVKESFTFNEKNMNLINSIFTKQN